MVYNFILFSTPLVYYILSNLDLRRFCFPRFFYVSPHYQHKSRNLKIWENIAGYDLVYRDLKSDSKWKAQNYIQNFVSKKFRKQFYFLTCILPDYVRHDSLKEFWKNSPFENMRAGFLKSFKIHLGKLALKWCIFSHEKNIF